MWVIWYVILSVCHMWKHFLEKGEGGTLYHTIGERFICGKIFLEGGSNLWVHHAIDITLPGCVYCWHWTGICTYIKLFAKACNVTIKRFELQVNFPKFFRAAILQDPILSGLSFTIKWYCLIPVLYDHWSN